MKFSECKFEEAKIVKPGAFGSIETPVRIYTGPGIEVKHFYKEGRVVITKMDMGVTHKDGRVIVENHMLEVDVPYDVIKDAEVDLEDREALLKFSLEQKWKKVKVKI